MMLSKYLVVMYILVLLLSFIVGHDYFGFKYFIVRYDAGLFWMMLGMIILVLSILNRHFVHLISFKFQMHMDGF